MEDKSNIPAQNSGLIELKYVPQFSSAKYELFEVDSEIAEKILKKGCEMVIKSYIPPVKRETADLLGLKQAESQT